MIADYHTQDIPRTVAFALEEDIRTGDITAEYLNGVENQRGAAQPAKPDSGDGGDGGHDDDDGQLDLNLASSGGR